MNHCHHCGAPFPEGSSFCSECGQQVRADANTAPPYNPGAFYSPPMPGPARQDHLQSPLQNHDGRYFFEHNAGLIVFAAILLIALFAGVQNRHFLLGINIRHQVEWFLCYLPLVSGFVLTTRAFGPDFSLLGVITLGGFIYATTQNVAITLASCLFFGLFNSVLIVVLRIPSLIVSILMYQLSCSLVLHATLANAATIPQTKVAASLKVLGVLLTILSFLAVYFTRLGTPLSARPKRPDKTPEAFLAYPAAAVMAGTSAMMLAQTLGGRSTPVGRKLLAASAAYPVHSALFTTA